MSQNLSPLLPLAAKADLFPLELELPSEILDLGRLRSLEELGRSRDGFFQQLIETYRSLAHQRLASIQGAARQRSGPLLEGAAHSLKGSSSNLGLPRITAFCQLLEQLGQVERSDGVDALVERLEGELVQALEALDQRLTQPVG